MAISLLHCADLHLDAVLGNTIRMRDEEDVSSHEHRLLRDAPLAVLNEISRAAINGNVDAVVIAGDIFDKKENANVNLRARSQFTQFLHTLAENEINVILSLGNHDPLSHVAEISQAWPNNVHVFGSHAPHTITIESHGNAIAFHGVSYESADESRDLASRFPQKVEGSFNVGVLHTNVSGNSLHSNYAPSTLPTLTSYGYDYFALGHIHKRAVLSEHPLVSYSGNSQGLSAKPSEQEPKGCVIVSIDQPGGGATSEFVETDSVRYVSLTLTLENATTPDDIIRESVARISQQCNASLFSLLRVTVQASQCDSLINAESIRTAINDERSSYFLTALTLESAHTTWDDLIARDPFFSYIDENLTTPELSMAAMYGNKASLVEGYLAEVEAENPLEKSDVTDYLARVHNTLESPVS